MSGLVTLEKKESRHALTVLRVEVGEAVELLDGKGGIYQGFIAVAERGRVEVSVGALKAAQKESVRITLASAVIKPERMELLVQKASELGAHTILPLITERTVVRLSPERWKGKVERWQKIAQESCKQSGRSVAAQVLGPVLFKEVLKKLGDYELVLLPTLAIEPVILKKTLEDAGKVRSVLILIGPEGDFSKKEAELAVLSGAKPVSLGALVMRSETAALYALAVSSFFFQN